MLGHRESPEVQRPTLDCVKCGARGWFDQYGWVHTRVPAFPHRFVPAAAPSEAQQDRVQAQHVVDFGPLPEPHEVDCPCGFTHEDKADPLEEQL